MTADTAKPAKPYNLRKFAFQIIVGMIVGAAASYFTMHFFGGSGVDIDDPSRALAIGVGLIYFLLGAVVLFGLVAPGVGSKLLNVEDADELREQRRQLTASAATCIPVGVALIALSVGGTLVSGAVAATIAALALVATIVVGIAANRLTDEFMRSLGREAGTTAVYTATIIAAGWAILEQLGYPMAITPLGAFAGLCATLLAAIFWVTARRGLLVPR